MTGPRSGSIITYPFLSIRFSFRYPVGAGAGHSPISHRVRSPRFTFTLLLSFSNFAWHLTGSLAVILMITILSGILIALFMILPQSISTYFEARSLRKKITQLETELVHQKELVVFARKTTPTHEELLHIEQGAIEKAG